MRILGIDPGVATIGFGLIEADRARVRLLRYGVITTPAGLPLSTRLYQISCDLSQLLDQFQPDSQDYARRFHALMDRFTDDQPLRKELLGLADLHGLINCRHKHFFFRAGVQLGLALGSIAVLQDR